MLFPCSVEAAQSGMNSRLFTPPLEKSTERWGTRREKKEYILFLGNQPSQC